MTLAATGVPAGAGITKADYSTTGVEELHYPPVNDGFTFPAEWVRHEKTVMQFLPAQNWNRHQLDGGRKEWAAVANAVAEFEPVLMAVAPEDRKVAEKLLSSQIELVEMPMNDGWSRDSGPMVLTDGKGGRRVAGFTFNGWGAKFPPYDDDLLVKARFAKHRGMALHPVDIIRGAT